MIETLPFPRDGDLLALHVRHPARYPCLLESVASGTPQGQFDVLFAFPGATLRLDPDFTLHGPHAGRGGFLAALDDWWRAGETRAVSGPVPFTGGWFVFLGYELLREIEPTVPIHPCPPGPVACAIRFPLALVRRRETGEAWAVAEAGHEAEFARLKADALAVRDSPPEAVGLAPAATLEEPDPAVFLSTVARARCHIAAGDVFQVNLARHWTGRLHPGVAPWQVYANLRRTNPAPFAGIATAGPLAILSSSPERLVTVRDGWIETRPIAGTRPRDAGRTADEPRRAELLAHPKERAEHIMLIDLERNDLGRLCQPGTVALSEFMAVESYAHVHHLVSNVRGRLRAGVTPGDVVRAVFPGGTITGCPKVRAMELIHALEPRARGAYTGAMGYLNRDGSCDFNILIRSITITGGTFGFAAGSGIVADSEPLAELEETRAKARGLVLALGGCHDGVERRG